MSVAEIKRRAASLIHEIELIAERECEADRLRRLAAAQLAFEARNRGVIL